MFINKIFYLCGINQGSRIMSKRTDFFFNVLNIVSWIIFIGLAIDTGGYLTNTIWVLLGNSTIASNFWNHINLSDLYQSDLGFFICLTVLLSTISLLKTILFYQTVSIVHKKKVNLENPFNETIKEFIFNFSFIALGIGLLAYVGKSFSHWLINQGLTMPDLESMKLGGSDVWIFMGITLLIVAKIFKKGIEIQSEIDLTI